MLIDIVATLKVMQVIVHGHEGLVHRLRHHHLTWDRCGAFSVLAQIQCFLPTQM